MTTPSDRQLIERLRGALEEIVAGSEKRFSADPPTGHRLHTYEIDHDSGCRLAWSCAAKIARAALADVPAEPVELPALIPGDCDYCAEGVLVKIVAGVPMHEVGVSVTPVTIPCQKPAPEPLIGTPRDWTEDATHENGNYANQCGVCGKPFVGHKRRSTCKLCAVEPVETRKEWRISWDSRNVAGARNAFIASSVESFSSSLDSLTRENSTGIEIESRTISATPWEREKP